MESCGLFGHPLSRNFKTGLRESAEANEPWFGSDIIVMTIIPAIVLSTGSLLDII